MLQPPGKPTKRPRDARAPAPWETCEEACTLKVHCAHVTNEPECRLLGLTPGEGLPGKTPLLSLTGHHQDIPGVKRCQVRRLGVKDSMWDVSIYVTKEGITNTCLYYAHWRISEATRQTGSGGRLWGAGQEVWRQSCSCLCRPELCSRCWLQQVTRPEGVKCAPSKPWCPYRQIPTRVQRFSVKKNVKSLSIISTMNCILK